MQKPGNIRQARPTGPLLPTHAVLDRAMAKRAIAAMRKAGRIPARIGPRSPEFQSPRLPDRGSNRKTSIPCGKAPVDGTLDTLSNARSGCSDASVVCLVANAKSSSLVVRPLSPHKYHALIFTPVALAPFSAAYPAVAPIARPASHPHTYNNCYSDRRRTPDIYRGNPAGTGA